MVKHGYMYYMYYMYLLGYLETTSLKFRISARMESFQSERKSTSGNLGFVFIYSFRHQRAVFKGTLHLRRQVGA
jgi:hypothetical protein